MKSENYFLNCHSEESVKIRFRKLSVKLHPDKNSGDPDATKNFQEMLDQRDETLRTIYKKSGISDAQIETKLSNFMNDFASGDFSGSHVAAKTLEQKFREENPGKELNAANLFPFVVKNLIDAVSGKNKLKGSDQKKLGS